MSDSIHMTVKQVVRESGYSYGSQEFRRYVFEQNIELLAEKKALKKEQKNKRQLEKLALKNT